MENIVLFGGGLHAHVCVDIIEKQAKYKIIGIIDSLIEIGSIKYGYPVIGRQEELIELKRKYDFSLGFVAIGDNFDRYYVRNQVLELIPDFKFINAIHPSAVIGRNVELGVGIAIAAGVIINPNSAIKDFCILNTGALLEHDCYMGEFSHLSVGSVTGGKTSIGKFSAVTVGVTIIDRITIGENTVVGSGSVVIKDLPGNVVAFGCPAKVIRKREPGEKFLKTD